MFCPQCGNEIRMTTKFCVECGAWFEPFIAMTTAAVEAGAGTQSSPVPKENVRSDQTESTDEAFPASAGAKAAGPPPPAKWGRTEVLVFVALGLAAVVANVAINRAGWATVAGYLAPLVRYGGTAVGAIMCMIGLATKNQGLLGLGAIVVTSAQFLFRWLTQSEGYR